MDWCTAWWLFCVKTIMKITQIWTSPSEEEEEEVEEEEEDDFGCLATFWFSTFAMRFSAIVMKTLEDKQ